MQEDWLSAKAIVILRLQGFLSRYAPLLEISGGLKLLGDRFPLYTLLLLPFGGLSCIAQTGGCIRNTGLALNSYILHKMVLTVLTAAYYLGWFLLSPDTFLL